MPALFVQVIPALCWVGSLSHPAHKPREHPNPGTIKGGQRPESPRAAVNQLRALSLEVAGDPVWGWHVLERMSAVFLGCGSKEFPLYLSSLGITASIQLVGSLGRFSATTSSNTASTPFSLSSSPGTLTTQVLELPLCSKCRLCSFYDFLKFILSVVWFAISD